MTPRRALGLTLVSLPFVGIFVYGALALGPLVTLGTFAIAGGICAAMFIGVPLAMGSHDG